MRFIKFLGLQAAILTMIWTSVAAGQSTIVPSARFHPQNAELPQNTAPFADLGAFQYDAQMFAPYDLRDLDEPEAPVGFYFTYDRTYKSVSRPGPQAGVPSRAYAVGNDFAWGNRLEGGFMTEDDKGWHLQYNHTEGSFFSAGQDVLVPNPFLTNTNLYSFKLDRVFRQEVSTGGFFEPYFGFRYTGLTDKTIEDTTFTVGGATFNNRFIQSAENSAAGGHVGARYTRKMGRWGLSTDGSLALNYNSQRYFASDISDFLTQTIFETTSEASTFLPALDLRIDLSYAITRDLAVRTGAEILYLWDGVNRANTLTSRLNPNSALGPGALPFGVNNESFVTAGFNFGVEWKR